MKDRYDVVVIGGGTAGVIAAIQAGRAGSRTLLVEKTGILGGTITNGGVDYPGLFHAWGHQVIAGIGWEMVQLTVEESGGKMPDFTDYRRPHHHLQIRVNTFLYSAICENALCDADVDVLYHAMIAGITQGSGESGWKLTLCAKTGLKDVAASVVVDCTGDANVCSIAGFELNIPDDNQPATLSCRASGYDIDALDIEAVNEAFAREVEAGRISPTDAGWNTEKPNVGQWLRSYGNNASHVHHINARSSVEKSRLELEARAGLLRLYRFLKKQPGLENLEIDHVCPECGVRETATIKGLKTITAEDYKSGRLWDDAVCYAFYPIDLHRSDGDGLGKEPLAEGVVPSVPLGALIPSGSRNFLVAGRCLSSDRLANSALRVEATCMATGQAAGAAAALCAEKSIDPRELKLSDLQQVLEEHIAIFPSEEFSETIRSKLSD